jgi:hypothetical protein
MKSSPLCKLILPGLAACLLSQSQAFACAACYGKTDSPLAVGMNWGIFSLLAVVLGVLGGFGAFFIFLARRAAGLAAAGASQPPSDPNRKL